MSFNKWWERFQEIIDYLSLEPRRSIVDFKKLSRELARTMARHRQQVPSGVYVPSHYVIYLPAQEVGRLKQENLVDFVEQELAQFLKRYVNEHQYLLRGPLRVQLVPDSGMRADPLRIDASFASQEVYEGPTAFGPWEGLASACLEIIDGPQKGDTFPLTHCPITIGRWASGPVHQEGSDPDTDKTHVMACDAHRPSHLVLEDPSQEISERHAHIELDKGEYYLIDHSTNGTKVNGEELKPNVRYRLNDGAEISLAGQVRLRFRRHGPGGTVLQRENPS